MATTAPAMKIEITGLREMQARLKEAGVELPREIRLGLNEIVNVIMLPRIREKMEAQFVLPIGQKKPTGLFRSGKLLSRTRATSQQRVGQITEGAAAQPYAGWWEFGGYTHSSRGTAERAFVREGRTLYPTLAEETPAIKLAAAAMMDRLAEIANGAGESVG